jgi:hypothetical protein
MLLAALQVCAFLHVAAATPDRSPSSVRRQLEAVARELVAGLANGEWSAWERHTCDDLLYTTEFGRTLTKQELRAAYRPLPANERRTLTMNVIGARSQGDAGVLVYELQAPQDEGIERYRITDTYWRSGGAWRLVASQAVRVVADPDRETGSAAGDDR